MIMNKFIKVTSCGETYNVSANHILAVKALDKGCGIYLSYPILNNACLTVDESCDEVLSQINE